MVRQSAAAVAWVSCPLRDRMLARLGENRRWRAPCAQDIRPDPKASGPMKGGRTNPSMGSGCELHPHSSRSLSLAFVTSLATPSAVEANAAVVLRTVNVKPTAWTKHSPIAVLHRGDQVTLISPTARSGFVHVQTGASVTGWAWKRNLRVKAADEGTGVSTSPPAAFPANWARPQPVDGEFTGSSGVHCGSHR